LKCEPDCYQRYDEKGDLDWQGEHAVLVDTVKDVSVFNLKLFGDDDPALDHFTSSTSSDKGTRKIVTLLAK